MKIDARKGHEKNATKIGNGVRGDPRLFVVQLSCLGVVPKYRVVRFGGAASEGCFLDMTNAIFAAVAQKPKTKKKAESRGVQM